MYQIKTMNEISPAGLAVLDKDRFAVGGGIEGEDGLLVRSADLHGYPFPDSLLAIARAGAGTNNIPVEECSERGIVVFNTPGANANAVKELTICALLLASRRVTAGAAWLQAQAAAGVEVDTVVEKGKKQFAGPELRGKVLGVVGLGAIGVQVCNAAAELGMTVFGYDPFLSVTAALSLSRAVHLTAEPDWLWKNCDYVTLHLPLNDKTKGMVDAGVLEKMKKGARLVNMARGGLVDDGALLEALESGKLAAYVTDFPNNRLLAHKNVTALPHLGASTPESEDNCAVMAAGQLRDFLENGNIVNSVNLPSVTMERTGAQRLCVVHRNIPAMLSSVTLLLSQNGVNVENMTNKSRGDHATVRRMEDPLEGN